MSTTCGFGALKDLRLNELCIRGKKVIDSRRNINCKEMKSGNVCTNLIKARKEGDDIVIFGNIVMLGSQQDLMCGNLSNVQAVFVNQMFGKDGNSTIHFEDDANFRDDNKITFDNAILIGSSNTTAVSGGTGKEIVIGKNARASLDSIAIGFNVNQSGLNTNRNISIGQNVGQNINYSYNNIMIGYNACQYVGLDNGFGYSVFIGPRAGRNFGSNGLYSFGDVFIGYGSGAYVGDYSSTNVGVGMQTLWNNSGYRNVAIGERVMNLTTGTNSDNVCLGTRSGDRLGNSYYNVILGSFAQTGTATINNTVVIGSAAICRTGSSYNTAIGTSARINVSSNSVLIGAKSRLASTGPGTNSDHSVVIGADNTVGTNNTSVGNFEHTLLVGAQNTVSQGTSRSNDIVIGTNNAINHSNCIVLGSYNTTTKDNSFVLGSSTLPLEVATTASDPMNGQTTPANVASFLNVFVNGVEYKLGLFAV